MRKTVFICICVVFFGLSGCAALPQKPIDDQSAAIGISLQIDRLLSSMVGYLKPDTVLFVKLDEGSDSYLQRNIIQSNYSKDKNIYLLNAAPGRYVAVAAIYGSGNHSVKSKEYITYFSHDLIKNTETAVSAGTMAFMGDYIIDMSIGLSNADEAQLFYNKLTDPFSSSTLMPALRMMTGNFPFSRGALLEANMDNKAKEEFINSTKINLKESGWEAMIKEDK